MSWFYESEKRYHEYSPGCGQNHGLKHMQTSGISQDASIYEHNHAYQITPQRPSQCQSQPPANCTTQRPTRQSIEAPDEYLDEYSDSVDGFQDNHPVEHLEDPPVVDRAEKSMNDPTKYRCQILDGHEVPAGYPTAGTIPVNGSFEDPNLTAPSSWEADDQLSYQATALRTVYSGAGDGKLPGFPHPDSNPYGPLAQNITGLELSGNEPPYLTPDIWWVRMSVARGRDLNKIAEELGRTAASVLKFIGEHKLPWTPLQDDQLR